MLQFANRNVFSIKKICLHSIIISYAVLAQLSLFLPLTFHTHILVVHFCVLVHVDTSALYNVHSTHIPTPRNY